MTTLTYSESTATFTVTSVVGWHEDTVRDNAITAVRAHFYYGEGEQRREDWATVPLTVTNIEPLVQSTEGRAFCHFSKVKHHLGPDTAGASESSA